MHRRSAHLSALDGMRGLAALAVLIHHVGIASGSGIAPDGYLAVDFFFMLSGFVLGHAYDRRLAGGLGTARFLAIRLARLYPMVALGLALGLIPRIFGTGPHEPGSATLGQFLLIPVWTGAVLFPLDDPIWSIFYELACNAAHALGGRRIGASGPGLLAAGLGAAFLAMMLRHPEIGARWGYAPGLSFVGGFVRAGFSYAAGLALYRMPQAIRDRMPPLPATLPMLLLLVVLLVPATPNVLLDALAIGIVFPLMLLSGAAAVATPRQARICAWLGAISFPLYAIHVPLLVIARASIPGGHPPLWLAAGLAILLAAAVIERWIDLPLRRLLKPRVQPRPAG
jgi:peptidoglycan/LPS O-acetylase OafA/YrhL